MNPNSTEPTGGPGDVRVAYDGPARSAADTYAAVRRGGAQVVSVGFARPLPHDTDVPATVRNLQHG